jgi:predicted Zn-dependent protease
MKSLAVKALVILLLMSVVAAAGWFGRRAYQAATERRLTAQARQFLATNDLRNAALCLQRALQINPMSAPASGSMADMLESTGSSAALRWRIHAWELETNNMQYRLAWAQTALKAHNPHSARLALEGLDATARSSAAYYKLMGALHWGLKNASEAEKAYLEALRLEPTNQAVELNLATVRLWSTNQTSMENARQTLHQLLANAALRAIALRALAADAARRRDFTQAMKFSKELIGLPACTVGDRIAYLQLSRESASPESAAWRAGLEAMAQQSPETAFALGTWMTSAEGPTNALRWLEQLPRAVQTNQPVPLIITDCQIALQNWKGLLASVETQDWRELDFYRLALEANARRSLSQSLAAERALRKALRECDKRLDRFHRLFQATTAWGWQAGKIDVLRNIVMEFPKEAWAVDQLVTELHATGNTVELVEVLAKSCDVNPSDVRLKGCLANVCLLRGTELEKAHRLASEVYSASPNNPFYISTYAYSLYLQNRKDEALKVLSDVRPEQLEIPSVAAYFGTIQANSGHKAAAREPLQRAEAATLLPEEKEIVRQAIAKL